MKEKTSKQSRYVCPNNCGTYAMLNRGVSLALCHTPRCEMAQLIPFDSKTMRSRKNNERERTPKPYFCDRCGKGRDEGIHVLTIVGDKALCYDCSKDYNPVSKWKYHSKNSSE